MRLLAPAWTAPQQSARGDNKANGTSPSPSFYTLVLFSTPNVQLIRPKSGGRPDGVGLALLLKADDLGGAAIKMIDLRVRCRRALLGRGMSPHHPRHSRTGNCPGSVWSCSDPMPVRVQEAQGGVSWREPIHIALRFSGSAPKPR